MSNPASHRTHLVSLSPWRNALDVYVADDETAEAAQEDLVWEPPEAWDVGDIMIIVVPGRQRAILNVEVFSSNSEQGTFESEDSADPYTRGVSVAAIEARLRRPVPDAPATLDATFAHQLLNAISEEAQHPTPWYLTDTTGCADGSAAIDPEWTRAEGLIDPWRCFCCDKDYSSQPFWAGRDALQLHQCSVDDVSELNVFIVPTGPAAGVTVCGGCHAMLHNPFGPSVLELLLGWRPPCPHCGRHHALRLLHDRPASPPPPGSIHAFKPATDYSRTEIPQYRCGNCQTEWRTPN
ncbi:hypothetical protein [Rhodococcoides fascians]|uniref:hypothetical protein n=1 Tax=Rhodococcoides fascians TaxID=1828 RepID=UPI00366CEE4B